MARYLLRRVAQAAVVVAGVVVLTFVVTRLVPGNPALTFAGPRATPEQIAAVTRQFELDKPLPYQLWRYVTDVLHGDLGTSLVTHQTVVHDLSIAFPASLALVGSAMVVAILLGIPLGILATRYRGRPTDTAVRVQSMLAVSLPAFWLALVAQQIFATKLGWFPVAGEYDQALAYSHPLTSYTHISILDALIGGNWPVLGSALWHLVLPALVMAAYPTGLVAQLTRANLTEEVAQEHATMARAIGFPERTILSHFALRPALSPVISITALVFAYLLVNSFLVESAFGWPGLGQYAANAIQNSDTPAIAGVTLAIAIVYVVANLAVDLVQTVVDPRVSLR